MKENLVRVSVYYPSWKSYRTGIHETGLNLNFSLRSEYNDSDRKRV